MDSRRCSRTDPHERHVWELEYPSQTEGSRGLTMDVECPGLSADPLAGTVRPVVVDADVNERWWHKVDAGGRQTTNLLAVLDDHGCVSVTQEMFSRLMEDAGWTPGRAP